LMIIIFFKKPNHDFLNCIVFYRIVLYYTVLSPF
jgi:hypothetical protein